MSPCALVVLTHRWSRWIQEQGDVSIPVRKARTCTRHDRERGSKRGRRNSNPFANFPPYCAALVSTKTPVILSKRTADWRRVRRKISKCLGLILNNGLGWLMQPPQCAGFAKPSAVSNKKSSYLVNGTLYMIVSEINYMHNMQYKISYYSLYSLIF